jgi:hypothetical protein
VWPRERADATECLRIGRHAVERWKRVDGTLSRAATHALPQEVAPQPKRLIEAISAMYSADIPTAPGMRITLVLESAWLPVMLIDTGPTLLRASQVEALVRHRLGMQFSDGPDPVAGWELRIEQRAGSRHALAYGLAPRLKQTLIEAARTANLEWASMTPALAWGLEHRRSAGPRSRSNEWFLWPEQDRTLVARVLTNDVNGLNPGAPKVLSEAHVLQAVDAESVRLGITSIADPIVAATWDGAPRVAQPDERIQWLGVRSSSRRDATILPKAAERASA